jgi:hypothetical protein
MPTEKSRLSMTYLLSIYLSRELMLGGATGKESIRRTAKAHSTMYIVEVVVEAATSAECRRSML